MTKEQCIRERDDREMILHPDWWPMWPSLALKRRRHDGSSADRFGVLLEGPALTVYLNLMGLPITSDTPRLEYETVEDLLADGWVVD